MNDAAASLPRIGMVGTDSLRLVGLQAILGHGTQYEMFPLAAPRALDEAGLELVIIDSSATPHLFELIAAFRRMRPQIRLMVLGQENDFDSIVRMIGAGVKGYLTLTATEEELRMAVEIVRDGSVWAPRKVLSRLLENSQAERTAAAAVADEIRFTRREAEVLRLLVQGFPNREIALALEVDEGAVKAHLGRLMRKAGVDNRTALSMRALERRWPGN